MKAWLFNPFKFIAGSKALLLGLGSMLITAIVCLITTEHLDGVIDIHKGMESPAYFYFLEPGIDWLCLVLPLYISGRIFSISAIRFIDIAGTTALARYPIFFAVLLNMLIPKDIGVPQKILGTIQTNPHLMIQLVFVGLLIIPFIIWTVALMYNAYSTSVNLKGQKAGWSFAVSLIIAEILSKIIIASIM